jgi:hypothetical protein
VADLGRSAKDMIGFLFLGLIIAVATLRMAYEQFQVEKRPVFGSFLYALGGVTAIAAFGVWPLFGINSLFKTSGEPFDGGPLGSPIAIALLATMYGSPLCFLFLVIALVRNRIERLKKK